MKNADMVSEPPAHWYAGAAVISSWLSSSDIATPNIDGLKTCLPSKVSRYLLPMVRKTGKNNTHEWCE